MSDKKSFEQEYQYVDDVGSEENPKLTEDTLADPQLKHANKTDYFLKINRMIQQPNIRRNALIAFVCLIFFIMILKFFTEDELPKKSPTAPPNIPPVSNPILQAPALMPAPSTKNIDDNRLTSLEQNLQSSVSALQENIGQLNRQVNGLASTNQALMTQVAELAAKLTSSQQALAELLAATKAKPVIAKSSVKKVYHQAHHQSLSYFVQAVIPGRAWLINSQGGNLTVRVGSKIPGLGIVHRIDALQGRVTMSSGRVIVFAQAD